jgi:hypothetical protein
MTIMNEVLARISVQPDLSGNPIFLDFVDQHSEYVRIHDHLAGLFSTLTNPNSVTQNNNALEKRRNRLRTVRLVNAVADPYVAVWKPAAAAKMVVVMDLDRPTIFPLERINSPLWKGARRPFGIPSAFSCVKRKHSKD